MDDIGMRWSFRVFGNHPRLRYRAHHYDQAFPAAHPDCLAVFGFLDLVQLPA
jgi:hypothetical protein